MSNLETLESQHPEWCWEFPKITGSFGSRREYLLYLQVKALLALVQQHEATIAELNIQLARARRINRDSVKQICAESDSDLTAAQATIQQQARELEEAHAVIQLFGDSATDTFEQMLRGHWTDDHGHPVRNNTAMLSLKAAVEKALASRSARAQQESEAKKEK